MNGVSPLPPSDLRPAAAPAPAPAQKAGSEVNRPVPPVERSERVAARSERDPRPAPTASPEPSAEVQQARAQQAERRQDGERETLLAAQESDGEAQRAASTQEVAEANRRYREAAATLRAPQQAPAERVDLAT